MAEMFSSGSDPSPRRASPRAAPSPGDPQPEGDASGPMKSDTEKFAQSNNVAAEGDRRLVVILRISRGFLEGKGGRIVEGPELRVESPAPA